MDKTQADAIAQAILEPELRVQEAHRSRHALASAKLARKRRIAWFGLAGSGIGAAIAYLAGSRFSIGIIWGGLAGSTIGWLLTRRAAA